MRKEVRVLSERQEVLEEHVGGQGQDAEQSNREVSGAALTEDEKSKEALLLMQRESIAYP